MPQVLLFIVVSLFFVDFFGGWKILVQGAVIRDRDVTFRKTREIDNLAVHDVSHPFFISVRTFAQQRERRLVEIVNTTLDGVTVRCCKCNKVVCCVHE